MSRKFPFVPMAAALALVLSLPAHAQIKDENLLVAVPDGYEIAYRDHDSKTLITEMVPAGETVDDWSEMVTVQIFRALKDVAPTEFRTHMSKQWSATCSGSTVADEGDESVNQYPAATWMLTCPLNPQSGKPEVTMFKAIQGRDSLYVVQKAFRWAPGQGEIDHWSAYLDKVVVCDTRRPERACPTGN